MVRSSGGARRGSAPALVALLTAAALLASVSVAVADPVDRDDDGPDPVPPSTSASDARGIDRVCPPPWDADDSDAATAAPAFDDVGETHADAIRCAAGYGLVSGFEDGTFRPSIDVTRGQVATFVVAWLRAATGFSLDVPEEQPFTDVDGVHADAIAALADVGIVGGREDGTFRPDDALTRGQFAAVVTRAISYADVFDIDGPLPPPAPDDLARFDDIEGSTFEDEIRSLAAARITTGTSDDTFSPSRTVTRGQLATFLMRSADYLDRHQRWRPTAVTVVLSAQLLPVGDDGPSAPEEPDDDGTWTDRSRATVSLVINAFNGTLTYVADLSDVPSSLGDDAALEVRLGSADEEGPLAATLADAETLQAARDTHGVVTGTVLEADNSVRLADLIVDPERVGVELRSDRLPGGRLWGQLGPNDAA